LHDYVQHYRPITPDEETLVQQLAALQFRHLKVQEFQADAMRAEVLRQCQNVVLEADGSIPTETAIQTRAFEALCEKPSFRLYIQELNRLPNKIQRTIDRIYILLRLRKEAASWSVNLPQTEQIPEADAAEQPKSLEIQLADSPKSEQTAQPQETKLDFDPILSKDMLVYVWNECLDPESRSILFHGPFDWSPRLEFFVRHQLPEWQFWAWMKEAIQEGLISTPQNAQTNPLPLVA